MLKKTHEVIINILIRPILIFIGFMCIWYFLAVSNFIGYISSINYLWVFIGFFIILTAVLLKLLIIVYYKMHKILKIIFSCLIIAVLSSFIIIESLILINARYKNHENADYIIILGAGLYRGGPSLTLFRRINAAINYSYNNPNVKIIVSGGTPEGMRISEAEVMSRVLQSSGININRIIIEDRSSNTYENLKYSSELISNLNKKVVISSSEFHLFRAQIIAKKLDYENIGTLASRTPDILLPNYYLREYFAVIKTLLFD